MTTRKLAALAVAVLALAVAGCGGDDEGDSASPETTAEATVEETTEAETTATSGDDASAGEDPDLSDLSGECLELATIGTKIAEAVGATSGSSGAPDLEASADAFGELVGAAPDEIKDDLQVIADGFAEFVEQLEGVDLSGGTVPSPEDLAKLQEASSQFDDSSFQEASKNIEAWTQENCQE